MLRHDRTATAGSGPTTKPLLALLSSSPHRARSSSSESCYALSMAPRLRKSLRLGARVFATDACYNQEHLKYVLDASGDLVPMLFDPWHASTRDAGARSTRLP